MIKLLSNRELADALDINLARWKRWSREFLPPDPLAGKQAGYARQYYVNDAFTVFLGGYLVSELGFSTPQARTILADISPWIEGKGFRGDARGKARSPAGIDAKVSDWSLTIRCLKGEIREYRLEGILDERAEKMGGVGVRNRVYTEETLPGNRKETEARGFETEKIMKLTSLFQTFLQRIDPSGQYFVRNGP